MAGGSGGDPHGCSGGGDDGCRRGMGVAVARERARRAERRPPCVGILHGRHGGVVVRGRGARAGVLATIAAGGVRIRGSPEAFCWVCVTCLGPVSGAGWGVVVPAGNRATAAMGCKGAKIRCVVRVGAWWSLSPWCGWYEYPQVSRARGWCVYGGRSGHYVLSYGLVTRQSLTGWDVPLTWPVGAATMAPAHADGGQGRRSVTLHCCRRPPTGDVTGVRCCPGRSVGCSCPSTGRWVWPVWCSRRPCTDRWWPSWGGTVRARVTPDGAAAPRRTLPRGQAQRAAR